MAKNKMISLIIAIATALASIAVGMGMVDGIIAVPLVGAMVNMIAGYVVIAGGILEALKMFGIKIL